VLLIYFQMRAEDLEEQLEAERAARHRVGYDVISCRSKYKTHLLTYYNYNLLGIILDAHCAILYHNHRSHFRGVLGYRPPTFYEHPQLWDN